MNVPMRVNTDSAPKLSEAAVLYGSILTQMEAPKWLI